MNAQLCSLTRRLSTLFALLVPVLALIALNAPRALAADTLQVAIDSPAPEQGIPFSIIFSGSSTATNNEGDGPSLIADVRPAGGVGCQADYADDHSAAGGASTEIFGPEVEGWGDEPSQGPGAYEQATSYDAPDTGTFIVCAWLESQGQALAGPATATFSVRGPQVSELSVGLPAGAQPNVAFQVDYTTHTDQKLSLSSVIRPSGGLPCAADEALDTQQNQDETSLTGEPWDDGFTSIFGGPLTNTATVTEPAGPYLICTWIEGPNTNEVDAAASTNIYVGTPPSPPAPMRSVVHATSPRLLLGTQRISKRHGTVISGTAAGALAGRLRIAVACGRSSVSGQTRVVRGGFRLALATPRGCHRGAFAEVRATWPGSSAFLKQSVFDRVRVTR
jgi:hypothetical protein